MCGPDQVIQCFFLLPKDNNTKGDQEHGDDVIAIYARMVGDAMQLV